MRRTDTMGVRRFGAVNWIGLRTLYGREVHRFATVWTQTILAPVMTSALFMVVFSLAFGARRGSVHGTDFTAFLAPGILMMSVIQNSFANTSSSIMISKIQGNIVDTLMPPLSPGELLSGYALGGVARGSACALATGAVVFPFAGVGLAHPLWALAFILSGSLMLALMGMLASIYAEKFDQLSVITNFAVTPLAFLSGTFYSIEVLPQPFRGISLANPFFHLVDGFRFGAIGTADSDPVLGLCLTLAIDLALGWVAWDWLRRGYRLKS